MKTTLIAAALSLTTLTAQAESVRVSRAMCMDMALTAENIALDYEAGESKTNVEARWIHDSILMEKRLHRASIPVLRSIVDDLYSGVMRIEAQRMFDEVYKMCVDQMGNYVTFEGTIR